MSPTSIAALALVTALLAVGALFYVRHRLGELAARLDQALGSQRDVPRQLAESDALQARALAEVRERLGALLEQTRHLDALGMAVEDVRQIVAVPKLRGTLGELWLEELLREALPSHHWVAQHAFRSGERVDAVLRLGDRLVPVDAKFPLEPCRRMLAAQGEEREREARAFARSLRARVDEIASKYIRPDEGTYDFALMYVPAEGVYWEALQQTDTLEYARERNVVVVSPNTFYAYLQAILHGLRGLTVEARARELLDELAAITRETARYREAHDLGQRHLMKAVRQLEEAGKAAAGVESALRRLGNPPDEGG